MARIPSLKAIAPTRRVLLGLAIGLAVAVPLSVLRGCGGFEGIELRLVDLRTRNLAGQRAPDDRILVMQIQESDVDWAREQLGEPWPWSLEINARLVGVLDEAGAAALMVDVLHLDRGAGPDDVPDKEDLDDAQRSRRELEAEMAKPYGAALVRYGKAAVAIELSDAPRYDLGPRRTAALERLGPPGFEAPPGPALGAELPVRHVAEGAAVLGFVNVRVDPHDGVVRSARVLGSWDGRCVLSLPLATAVAAGIPVGQEAGHVVVDGHAQRAARGGDFLVDFRTRGTRSGHARVDAAQVLDWAIARARTGALPDAAREALAGKIVVFGINAAGVRDVLATPMGSMDGPDFQATVLDDLLHGDGRVRASSGTNGLYLFVVALLLGALGAGLRGRLRPHVASLVVAAAFTWFVLARFAAGTSLDLFTPLLAILLTWGGTTALRQFTSGRRNRWLESTFGRYMAAPIIEALKQDPSRLALGGRQTEITVLFSDVANFTSHSVRLDAEQIVVLLNRYLTGHCNAVMDEGGVVDKFEGDAVMAFFGDPVPQEDHAVRACRAALRVIQGLPDLEPVWREMGLDEFRIRIGLNSGVAVVGNMGSDQRFEYTCIGDTVNLASRLESAAKVFGADILVGAATAAAARDVCLLKSLGSLVVVGREEPEPVAELLALKDEASDELVAHVAAFEEALDAVRADDLERARERVAEAERLRPGDGPCAWLARLLTSLEFGDVSGPWDGVTRRSSK